MRRSTIGLAGVLCCVAAAGAARQGGGERYEERETREVVGLVKDAAALVRAEGPAAFAALREPGSRFRQDDLYVFVLGLDGTMLVHPDKTMEGKNELGLEDVHGKPIIRGLIDAATANPAKPEGWYHYQWPIPGELLPRWKSSYVQLVQAPSGARYVVGAGVYDDRMERSFVVDLVKDAVGRIEKNGRAAFPLFRDPRGPFLVKDAYVFVLDPNGVALVHPGFPNLEGRSLLDVKDTRGKHMVRAMMDVVRTRGSGWVDYLWPKPGESVSTQKSTYVMRARLGDSWVLVGCGVYLADAPKAPPLAHKPTAPELMALVRDAGALLHEEGAQAFPALHQKGSRWYHDDTYLFVWSMDGTRVLHAADPAGEGQNERDMKDIHGRPIGHMILDVGRSPSGEGWIHYMYPEPGNLFPTWKSTFLKRVTFPSGQQYIVGSGIYDMQMNEKFIEDMIDRAAARIAAQGTDAFPALRDQNGPFRFMDTYVFVLDPEGTQLVNGAFPSLEGRNIANLHDLSGRPVIREEIDAALRDGSAWLDVDWYKPGTNRPAHEHTYVRKVQSGGRTFIVGSGIFQE